LHGRRVALYLPTVVIGAVVFKGNFQLQEGFCLPLSRLRAAASYREDAGMLNQAAPDVRAV
jgi:hypothetical protein